VHGRFDRAVTQAPGREWYSEPPTDLHGGYSSQPPITDEEWRFIREAARQRAESLSVVDESIGQMMRALRESGELGSTLVVFTSDNGYFLGERRIRHGKTHPYGPSARVPLLIRGPGIPDGQVRRDPYLSVDHAATLSEAAGIATPYVTDGISMLPVAVGGDRGWGRPVLTESSSWGADPHPSVQGIRSSRYFYTRWATGEEELFDVTQDFFERHNLAARPAYADIVLRMRSTLAEIEACSAAACSPPIAPELGAPPG
jgi:arylsulfatase A-like enzyme